MLSILPNHFKQLPENKSDNFLIFSHSKYVAKVTLNRPKALNAVNQDMIKSLDLELEKWNSAPNLKVVIFTGNGGKAFCAGGELKTTYEAKKNSNMDFILSYYREMFTLFYRTSLMKPIQIAFWDGIVIGAGAGLSLNAPIKIATEFTAFSMPEGKIGMLLGIGGGYHFSRMRNNLGYFLGLTGLALRGKEVVQCGIADFYVKREKLQELENAILEHTNESIKVEDIRNLVRKYAEPVENKYVHEELINTLFGKDSVEEIYKELEIASQSITFAKEMLHGMKLMSPVSLKIIFEQIKRGKSLDLKESLKEDFRMCNQAFKNNDFVEGVKSILIDKNYVPKWEYKSICEVPSEHVEKYFATLPEDFELQLP